MSVLQKDSVDIVGIEKATGNVDLIISDHLEWGDYTGEHMSHIQDKINTYLRFIESGELIKSYPYALNRGVQIRLCLKHQPSDKAVEFLNMAKGVIEEAGIKFVYELSG